MDTRARDIRFQIIRHCLDTCHPPTTHELAQSTNSSLEDVKKSLKSLEELHHLKLYPDYVPSPTPIDMVHPFSHLPTPYVVKQGEKAWWANCVWCGFGLVSMLLREESKAPITLKVYSGSINDELKFEIHDEIVTTSSTNNYVVHFSVPPSKFWNDVRYTCSLIQLFESEHEIDKWLKTHGFEKGVVITFKQLWPLAKIWYQHKADYNYDRLSSLEVEKLYESLGMTDEFWKN